MVCWAVAVVAWNPVVRATEPPQPTPTPRPGTLAALAGATSLTGDGTAPIAITNANLASFADGAVITIVTESAAECGELKALRKVDPKIREKWRRRVHTQKARIAALDTKRRSIEAEIERLERGSLDARTLDRIEKAEARLTAVSRDVTTAERTLSRIVHEARKEGATPGWFR
jgi:septal ring factor EnvC (AmiA/AmiB activator)